MILISILFLGLIQNSFSYATGDCCLARCMCDSAGPDDEGGGQKDLNKMCSLPEPSSTCADTVNFQEIAWNWDTVEFSGANSHDACALFDSNGNGYADFAMCASTQGQNRNVTKATLLLYGCRDNRPDRCHDAELKGCFKERGDYDPTKGDCATVDSLKSTFEILQRQGPDEGDPYTCDKTGPVEYQHKKSSPGDTGCERNSPEGWDQIADVCVHKDDLPLTAKLIDVCSYPSVNPNSDPSDCVVFTSCANLNCPSMLCAQQECSEDLGKCVPKNGTAVCSDGIDCTVDICEVTCDSTACAINPQPSFAATPVDANGCRYQGREYDLCVEGQTGAKGCGCEGTKCEMAAAAKRQVVDDVSWCVISDASLADLRIRYDAAKPSLSPVPPPIAAKDAVRPGCQQKPGVTGTGPSGGTSTGTTASGPTTAPQTNPGGKTTPTRFVSTPTSKGGTPGTTDSNGNTATTAAGGTGTTAAGGTGTTAGGTGATTGGSGLPTTGGNSNTATTQSGRPAGTLGGPCRDTEPRCTTAMTKCRENGLCEPCLYCNVDGQPLGAPCEASVPCVEGAVCVTGVCEVATSTPSPSPGAPTSAPGQPGGECPCTGTDSSDSALVCDAANGVCIAAAGELGTAGYFCKQDGTCGGALACDESRNKCVLSLAGSAGGPCTQDKKCLDTATVVCVDSVNVCIDTCSSMNCCAPGAIDCVCQTGGACNDETASCVNHVCTVDDESLPPNEISAASIMTPTCLLLSFFLIFSFTN